MPDENQLLIEIQGKDEASDEFDRLIGRAEKAAASFKSLEKALIPTESRLKELGKVDFKRVFSGLSEIKGSLQSLPVLDLKPIDTSQSVEALQSLANATAIATERVRELSSHLTAVELIDTSSSVSAISSLNEQLEIATDSLNQKISANIEVIDKAGEVIEQCMPDLFPPFLVQCWEDWEALVWRAVSKFKQRFGMNSKSAFNFEFWILNFELTFMG